MEKVCLGCKYTNSAFANFCQNCGRRLSSILTCGQCGSDNPGSHLICDACGAPLTAESAQASPDLQEDGGSPAAQGSRVREGFKWREMAENLALSLRKFRSSSSLGRSPARSPLDSFKTGGSTQGIDRPAASDPVSPPSGVIVGPVSTLRANLLWGVLAILSAVGGQWLLLRGQTTAAIGLYAVGILLALWAFRQHQDIAVPFAAGLGTIEKINPLWLLPVLILPGGVAAWSLNRLLLDPERPPDLFWLLHFASILLFIGCVYFVERRQAGPGPIWPRRKRAPDPSHPPASKVELPPWKMGERLAIFAILCIGLFLRLHELPGFPFGTWYDEARIGLEAQRILREPEYRPFFVSGILEPGHYVYLVASLFSVLPKITFVMRLVSVLFGTLSIPAAFMAGSQLFGRRPALILAFLVAVSRWSVNFSRIGMFNIPLTLFAFLGIGFLLRALRGNRLTDYLWAGLFLGFGLNFYFAFQVFLLVISVFILHYIVSHRRLLRYQWKGFLVAAMGALLFLAPLAAYALAKPDTYFSRTGTVSIFKEYPADQVWKEIRGNAASHLLMYNVRGDPNGRHNLPGAPMLAPVAGALLVLGLAISLSRFWRARSLLLIVWFLGMMSGGVFSLSFEAPQSLRAIGTLPVAYLLGTVPLALLWQNWRAFSFAGARPSEESGNALNAKGRPIWSPPGILQLGVDGKQIALLQEKAFQKISPLFLWRGSPVLFVTILLAAIAVHNYRTYFERQQNDFAVWNAYSTGESISAAIIAENINNAETDIYLTSHYSHHPTVRFVGNAESTYQPVDSTANLPMPLSPHRDALFLLDPERRSFVEQARKYYPNAEFVEHKPPFGGPTVLYEFRLRPSDIASVQGMNVSYFEGEEWAGPPVAVEPHPTIAATWPQDAPLAAPFSAEWSGVLSIDQYGPHKLILRAPAAAELYVDEELVAQLQGGEASSPDGEKREVSAALELALGKHSLRIRAVSGEGPVTLSWQRPGEDEQILPSSALHVPPVTSNGLLGRYYSNGNWQEPVAFTRIDPQIALYFHNVPLPRPYTVEWVGKIAIPQEGAYRLGIESIDESELWIDGEPVAASPEPNQYDESLVTLTVGLHDIRIRYADRTSHSHVNLHWTPPGQERQLVQVEALLPPQGSYAHVAVEDLSIFDEAPGAASPLDRVKWPAAVGRDAERTAGEARTAVFEIVKDDFERPRGVAVANGRLYAVDPSQRTLIVLESDGREVAQVRRSNRRFDEPVDVDVDAAGNVFVLDAGGGGQVSIHNADGDFVRVVPISGNIVERSRGLNVDSLGRIWLALTPAQTVAAYDANGQELIRFSTNFEGADLQPVDVAFHADDAIYVSTVGVAAVVRFSKDGVPLDFWPLVDANSVDGPHLALDGNGVLYVSQPEQGGFLRIPADSDEGTSGRPVAWVLPASQPIRKLVGIALDGVGNLVVTDSENGRIYRVPIEP